MFGFATKRESRATTAESGPGSSAVQGALWSADPRAWAEHAESRLRPLYDYALARLDLRAGRSVLDAGCGSGLFVTLAAREGAHTSGLDAAEGLVQYARGRFGAPDFVVGDLEALPYPDGAFDVVTAFNSIPYAANPRRAIAEIARVTSASGRALVTVGSGVEQSICAGVIDSLAPSGQVPDWDTFDLKDPERMRAAMEDAGLVILEQAEAAFDCTFASVDEAVRAQMPAGPVEAAVRRSGRNTVQQALRAFFAPRVRSDGSVSTRVAFQSALAERVQRPTRRRAMICGREGGPYWCTVEHKPV